MKKIILAASLFFAFSAQAEQISLVDHFEAIELRDGTLNVEYLIAGGCNDHTAHISTQLIKQANGSYVAEIIVMDLSPDADHCEALLSVKGEADLRQMIRQEAERLGLDAAALNKIKVQLPKTAIAL